MAEENEVEEVEESEKSEKKKKSPMLFIIIGLVAVLLVGGGVLGFIFLSSGSEKDEPLPEKTEESGIGLIYALQTFVVNLKDEGGKRYLKTRIELEYGKSEDVEGSEAATNEIKARLPQLRDVILLLLSNKAMEEIQGIDGKIALRNELIMRINQILKTAKIRNLFFTEFVIQ